MSISDYTSSDEEFIENEPALHKAVREADVVGLSALLESASDNDINRFYKDMTPLKLAASLGHTECVQALLNRGAYVNIVEYDEYDETDGTALHNAIEKKHTECAYLLLAAAADVRAYAVWGTPLHYAVSNDDENMARVLIERGANVNSHSHRYRYTPLCVAVSENATRCARLLLDYGANVHARDRFSKTPIFAASYSNKGFDAAKIVLDAGASLYVWDDDGNTPLHIAVKNNYYKFSIFLLQQGMSLRVLQRSARLDRQTHPKTPLKYAMWANKTARNVAAWVIQRAWREYIRTRAAYRIQFAWRQTYCNPIYMVCRRRLEREFAELNNA